MSKADELFDTSIVKDYNGKPRRYYPLGSDKNKAKRLRLKISSNKDETEIDAMTETQVEYALFFLSEMEFFDGQYWLRTIYKV